MTPFELAMELRSGGPDRECDYCGCTDYDACIDPETGEHCHWVDDGELGFDCCSACQKLGDAIRASGRIEIYTELEAQAFIQQTRSARIGALQ